MPVRGFAALPPHTPMAMPALSPVSKRFLTPGDYGVMPESHDWRLRTEVHNLTAAVL